MPENERNMMWQWMTNQSLRVRVANWEDHAQYILAVFRGFCDRNADDPWFGVLVEELMEESPFFKEQWSRYEVRRKSETVIHFIDNDLSIQSVQTTFFPHINSNENPHLFVCTPCG